MYVVVSWTTMQLSISAGLMTMSVRGAVAFGGQLPKNPGVWVGSYPVISGVVPASLLLFSRGHPSSSPDCSWSSPELLCVVLLSGKKREE